MGVKLQSPIQVTRMSTSQKDQQNAKLLQEKPMWPPMKMAPNCSLNVPAEVPGPSNVPPEKPQSEVSGLSQSVLAAARASQPAESGLEAWRNTTETTA